MVAKDLCALLDRLLSTGRETPWLEFKQNYVDPTQIGEYVSALANAALLQNVERGYLVYGVSDDELARTGTEFKPESLKVGNESLYNWLLRKLDPQVALGIHCFKCDEHDFVIFEIEPSYFKPVTFDGTAFIRIGTHKKRLKDHPGHERSIWIATGRRKFENSIASANTLPTEIENLLEWQMYFDLRGTPRPDNFTEVLRTFLECGFLADELDGTYAITNLGALLFARNIQAFPSVARKTVRVIRYRGIDPQNAEREVEGQKGYAIGFEALTKFISKNSPQREKITLSVRRSVPVIPDIAIREVVANALIHQDLTADGSGPVIEIYDNRIEVSNPGVPLGEVERIIDDTPKSRNEQLARTMRHLNLCEERGKGIRKTLLAIEVLATQENLHLPSPNFRAVNNGFIVTLFGPKEFKKLSKEEKLRTCYQHCVLCYLRNEYMNNSSLRERFSLRPEDYQTSSAIITDAVRGDLIAPADDAQGKRNARYVPAWARNQ